MPSLVMLPLIQCHQTRGLALSGGFWKPRSRASSGVWAGAIHVASKTAAPNITAMKMRLEMLALFGIGRSPEAG